MKLVFVLTITCFLTALVLAQTYPVPGPALPISYGGGGGLPSPLGKWLINEGGPATTALDSSGNSNHMTWAGSTSHGAFYTTGISPLTYGGNFVGNTDNRMLHTTAIIPSPTPVTFCVWVNPSSTTGTQVSIALLSTTTGGNWDGWYIQGASPNWGFVQVTNNTFNGTNGGTFVTGVTHLCLTSDNITLTGYVNGVAVASTTAISVPSGTNFEFDVGYSRVAPGVVNLVGTANDARLWTSVLTASQILAIYNAGPGA